MKIARTARSRAPSSAAAGPARLSCQWIYDPATMSLVCRWLSNP
jgi:hypothetical protein